MPLDTAHARAQAIAQHNDDPFLILLTIEHPQWTDGPFHVVRNNEPIVSRGNVYKAYPFNPDLPGDSEESPQARITIANVDREIGERLESVSTPPECTFEIVLASDPDNVERSWPGMSFTNAVWDAFRLTVTLIYLGYSEEPFPNIFVKPNRFPGLYK